MTQRGKHLIKQYAARMRAVAISCLFVASPVGLADAPLNENEPASFTPVSFQTANGWRYDGRVELPPKRIRRPWAVMLLGGGMGTKIDWEVPGLMAIDGKPTRDADTITQALLERGFVVMRWEAIRRDDPLYDESGLMFDAGPFKQTVEQAHEALAAFRAVEAVPDDHIFLVGHSLGAFRAAMLLDKNKNLPGAVMLAGAMLIPSKLDVVRSILAEETANLSNQGAENIDPRQRHETLVQALGQRRKDWCESAIDARTRYDTPWPAGVLMRNETPTLLLVGSLDERQLLESYLVTDYMRRHRHSDYQWRVYENLGHQLGPEQPGEVHHKEFGVIAKSRTGAIDPRVVQELVAWIEERAR